jgi:hypothetical protein
MGAKLLSLDMSTTCTGWSVFDIETKALLEYGKLKPKTSGEVAKAGYPRQQLMKMIDLAQQMRTIVETHNPTLIVIEEIAGSKNRLGQKTLDGLHYIVAWVIEEYLERVRYYDVTGASGWRTHLKLRLSDADKLANAEAKKLNKQLKASQRIPIIGPKHLACRYVNSVYNLTLNVDLNETDADVGDSIGMASAFLLGFATPKKGAKI